MRTFLEILIFRRMISPVLLQLLFWAGVAGCLYGAYVLYSRDHWAWVFPAFLGPLLVRVIFEHAIIFFRTYDELRELHETVKDTSKS